jgi:AraC-like DNA-binding protein
MYATISFTLAILGLFSFIELFKGNQKFSLLKYYMLGLIIITTASSSLGYLEFSGHSIPYYQALTRYIGTGVVLNIFCIITLKKIPKSVLAIEGFLSIIFIFMIFNDFEFPKIIDFKLETKQTPFQFILYLVSTLFYLVIFIYTFSKLMSKTANRNLYDIKIRNWTGSFYFLIILFFITHLILFILFLNGIKTGYKDSVISLFILKFMFLLFILFRPKFLDDDKYARPFNQLLTKNSGVTFQNFEFLFYSNNYYLLPEANMEDLALKLNTTKNELADFLKNQIDENFTDLLNKNRVEYLKELLKAKKYESFTIEALSEMSGFNNRRSMYNAFNKHVGSTPTEFIQSLR